MASAWITLTFARPGHGKSLDTARTVQKLFNTYKYVEKKYPSLPRRVLLCNLKLSPKVEELYLNNHLLYWENPRQLRYCLREHCWIKETQHGTHDVDIVIDELANYAPSDGWKDLPRWLRKLFAQHRHRGIRIYANTQDYMAIDINFRRMVAKAYEVQKIIGSRDISATLPPVKYIWGIVIKREFDPGQIEMMGINAPLERKGLPKIFFISKKLIEMYDTTQDLPEYMPDALEHLKFQCIDPDCKRIHIEHRKV